MMNSNNNFGDTYYLVLPGDATNISKDTTDLAIGWSTNEFVVNEYIRNTLPKIFKVYSKSDSADVDVYEFHNIGSDSEFYDAVKKSGVCNSEICSTNQIDIYESDNNPGFALYLTQEWMDYEMETIQEGYNNLVFRLWSTKVFYDCMKKYIKYPEPVCRVMELIGSVYFLLISVMNYTDIMSISNNEVSKAIHELLKQKGYSGEDEWMYSIFNVIDETLLISNYCHIGSPETEE